jgi:hypothetical protein
VSSAIHNSTPEYRDHVDYNRSHRYQIIPGGPSRFVLKSWMPETRAAGQFSVYAAENRSLRRGLECQVIVGDSSAKVNCGGGENQRNMAISRIYFRKHPYLL